MKLDIVVMLPPPPWELGVKSVVCVQGAPAIDFLTGSPYSTYFKTWASQDYLENCCAIVGVRVSFGSSRRAS